MTVASFEHVIARRIVQASRDAGPRDTGVVTAKNINKRMAAEISVEPN